MPATGEKLLTSRDMSAHHRDPVLPRTRCTKKRPPFGGRSGETLAGFAEPDQRLNTNSMDVFCMSFSSGDLASMPCAVDAPPISTATYCLPLTE